MSATPTISKISPENFHKPFTVIGLGEILIDQFPDFERIGGAPANALYHLHNLGLRTELLSAIGDDDSGLKILRWLEQQQLSREFISADPSHPTGTVTVTPTQTGSHRFVITQEVAWDYIPFLSRAESIITQADAVVYGTLAFRSPRSRKTLLQYIEKTAAGCLRVLDLNLRQSYYDRHTIENLLHRSDVLKVNEEELTVLHDLFGYSDNSEQTIMQLYQRFRLRYLALTRGERGSLLFDGSQYSRRTAAAQDIVDTVGAGDAFTAGLTAGMLFNLPLDSIHLLATTLAEFVCRSSGATPPYPPDILTSTLRILSGG